MQVVNRHPPFGSQVRDHVLKLPKYEVSIDQASFCLFTYSVDPCLCEGVRIKLTSHDLATASFNANNKECVSQRV